MPIHHRSHHNPSSIVHHPRRPLPSSPLPHALWSTATSSLPPTPCLLRGILLSRCSRRLPALRLPPLGRRIGVATSLPHLLRSTSLPRHCPQSDVGRIRRRRARSCCARDGARVHHLLQRAPRHAERAARMQVRGGILLGAALLLRSVLVLLLRSLFRRAARHGAIH